MDGKTAIAQMFYDARGFSQNLKLSIESRDKSDVVDEKYHKLQDKLSGQEEIWKLFKDFENALLNLLSEESADYYAEGFKFGLLLGVEAGESK